MTNEPHEDFGIDSLAAYLHLLPQQISRLVNRGKLPGRKVGGQWRFSRAEIHHWMETRMGLLDGEELARMESVLDRSVGVSEFDEFSLSRLLAVESIAVPLEARTKSKVILNMTDLAAATGRLWDSDKMAEAVRAREQLHPTALDNGVALLHPRRPISSILSEPVLALGRTTTGIPFGGAGGVMTDIFVLICSTDDRGHLRTLARISRLISDSELLDLVRTATDPQAVFQAILDCEAQLG